MLKVNTLATLEENKEYGCGTMTFLSQDANKDWFVEIEIMRSKPNRNKWDFQNVETYAQTFCGTPILCAYLPNQIGDGHNFKESRSPDGKVQYDFTGATAERIVGMISDNPDDIRTEERADGVWAIAKGKIWRFYNAQLVDKLARQGRMSVSAEIDTHNGYKENDIDVFTEWEGIGVTILHETVAPAVPGAHIQAIKAMSEEFKKMQLKAASYQINTEDDDVSKSSKENKHQQERVKKNMSLNKLEADRLAPLFDGYTIVGLSDDSKNVVLMNGDHKLMSYSFENDGEVIESRIVPVKSVIVSCSVDAEGSDPVPADLTAITKTMSESVASQSATIANLNAQIETLNGKVEAMEKVEHERRVNAVKDAIKRAQTEITDAGSDVDVTATATEIEGNIETYAKMEADGAFSGDTVAYDLLMSAYGKAVSKAQKEHKIKMQSRFVWDNVKDGIQEDGIAGLLSRING